MIYNIYLNIIVKVLILKSYTLIGPIGSGKTEAQKIFQQLNIKCFCADSIVRNLYEDEKIISKISNIIPCSISNGKIDISIMREIIFTNEKKMKLVENYIQPKVFLEFENIKKKYFSENIIIFVIPIIKNNKFIKKNNTIYINSNKKIRLERLKKRKNYNEKIIKNIMNYQESINQYSRNYLYFIENNGTKLQLKNSVQKILEYI